MDHSFTTAAVCKLCGEAFTVGESADRTLAVMALHIDKRHASKQKPPNEFFTYEVRAGKP